MNDPDQNCVVIEGEFEFVFCGGGAKPTDTHLASIVHCANAEIFQWLQQRDEDNGDAAR
jgi:hypothetical protein